MNENQSWEKVEIKSALGARVRKITRSAFGQTGIRKLGEILNRRKPPPGYVSHPDDGDGDGWTDEDDLEKRRYVGYLPATDPLKPRLNRAERRRQQRAAQRQGSANPAAPAPQRNPFAILANKVDEMIQPYLRTLRNLEKQRRRNREQFSYREKIPAVEGQTDEIEPIEQSFDIGAEIQKAIDDPDYFYTIPAENFSNFKNLEIDQEIDDFVEESFREIVMDDWMVLMREDPQTATMIAVRMIDDQFERVNPDGTYYDTGPEDIQPPYVSDALEKLLMMTPKERNETILRFIQDLTKGRSAPLSQEEEGYRKLVLDSLKYVTETYKSYAYKESQKMTEEEKEFLKSFIKTAMQQSPLFAAIVKTIGLPPIGIIKPTVPKKVDGVSVNIGGDVGKAVKLLDDESLLITSAAGLFSVLGIAMSPKGLIDNENYPDGQLPENDYAAIQDAGMYPVVGTSTESVLRHEYGHFLHMVSEGTIDLYTDSETENPEFIQALKTMFDENEKYAMDEIEKLVSENHEIKTALQDSQRIIREIIPQMVQLQGRGLSASEADIFDRANALIMETLNNFNALVKSKLGQNFSWFSAYAFSDTFALVPSRTNPGQSDFTFGNMYEFHAEFMAMITSPNIEVRKSIPEPYASSIRKAMSAMGLDWP